MQQHRISRWQLPDQYLTQRDSGRINSKFYRSLSLRVWRTIVLQEAPGLASSQPVIED